MNLRNGHALLLTCPAVSFRGGTWTEPDRAAEIKPSATIAFIWHFLSFHRGKDCLKLERDQWPGMTSQTALYSDFLSDSAARSCFEKVCFLGALKNDKNSGLHQMQKILRHFC